MKLRSMVMLSLGGLWLVGCATRVNVSQVHRENLGSASKVFAVAARDLSETLSRQRVTAPEQRAAAAAFEFHRAAENFAGVVGIWRNGKQVNNALERLIENHVDLEYAYEELTPDDLTAQAHRRMSEEWERLQRASGYAGRKYQKKIEDERRR